MLRTLCLLLVLATSGLAHAQQEGPSLRTLMAARNFGMASAYRAHGLGSEAVGGNPAALALYPAYRVELTGAWDAGQRDGFGSLAIVDSATSRVSAGLSYHLMSLGRGAERRTAHLSSLALAFPVAPGVLVGAAPRYLALRGAGDDNNLTLDTGMLVRFSQSFLLGVSGHNLIDTNRVEAPRYFTGHLAYLTRLFTFAGDLSARFDTDETQWFYAAGAEYLLAEAFPVRAGYAYDAPSGASFVGAGLGLLTQGGGVDFGYRHEVGGRQTRWLAVTFKLQLR